MTTYISNSATTLFAYMGYEFSSLLRREDAYPKLFTDPVGSFSFQEVARDLTRHVHRFERFKFVSGPYVAHPEWVATRMHSEEEVITALMHDVIETMVKFLKGKIAEAKPPRQFDVITEDRCIDLASKVLVGHFYRHGYDIQNIFPHLPANLKALTRRESEKDNYDAYGERLLGYAEATGQIIVLKVKLADLTHNIDRRRNRRGGRITPGDRLRLGNYQRLIDRIVAKYPGLDLKDEPLSRPQRVDRDENTHGGHARNHYKRRDRHGGRERVRVEDHRDHHRSFPVLML